MSYRHADGKESVSAPGGTITTEVDIEVVPFVLSAIYNHEIANSPLSVYGGCGFGIYFISTETEISQGGTTVSDDDDDLEFGLQVKGGALYGLTNRLDLSGALQVDLFSDNAEGVCFNAGVRYYF